MKHTSITDGLSAIWKDLSSEPVWKYDELPPFLLPQLTEQDLLEADHSDLARAIWFWLRRPKLRLPENVALIIVASCALISCAIALLNWRGTSMPERVTEVTLVLFEVAIVIYAIWRRLKSFRWRREYEQSIDRLIRTRDAEV